MLSQVEVLEKIAENTKTTGENVKNIWKIGR